MSYPEILYKYRAFNANLLMSLINGSVWFSKPADLNDPFDCQLVLEDIAPARAEFESKLENAFQQLATRLGKYVCFSKTSGQFYTGDSLSDEFKAEVVEFKGHVEKAMREVGVFSASSQCMNTTMWSHYGDYHKGVCIGYYTERLFPKNSLAEILRKVTYLKPEKIRCNVYDAYASCCCNADKDAYMQFVNSLVSVKSNDWEYEEEWRFIKELHGGICIGTDAICSISFGMRASVECKSTIRNILADVPMVYFQMRRSGSGLCLESVNMKPDSEYWNVSPED